MEGPRLKFISEKLDSIFKNKIILAMWGNSKKIDFNKFLGKEVDSISSHGKNLLIKIKNLGIIKIHFLMYGSYSIDKLSKDKSKVRVAIESDLNKVYFYNCSVDFFKRFKKNGKDILAFDWKPADALDKIKNHNDYICDVLLDQSILPGVGNIIKVEALYRAKVHPLSITSKIKNDVLRKILIKTRKFSEIFYSTAVNGESLKNYLSCYGKKICKNCGGKITRKRLGKLKRFSYFCSNYQVLYK